MLAITAAGQQARCSLTPAGPRPASTVHHLALSALPVTPDGGWVPPAHEDAPTRTPHHRWWPWEPRAFGEGGPLGARPGGQSGLGLQDLSRQGRRSHSYVKAKHLYKASHQPAWTAAVVSGHQRWALVSGCRGQVTGDSSGFPGGCRAGPGHLRGPTKYSAAPHLFTHAHIRSEAISYRDVTGRGREPVFFFFFNLNRGNNDGSESLFCVFPANQGFLPRSVGNDGTQQTLAGFRPLPPASSVGRTRPSLAVAPLSRALFWHCSLTATTLGLAKVQRSQAGQPGDCALGVSGPKRPHGSWLRVSGRNGTEGCCMRGLSILGESLFKYLEVSREILDFQPKSSFILGSAASAWTSFGPPGGGDCCSCGDRPRDPSGGGRRARSAWRPTQRTPGPVLAAGCPRCDPAL